MDDVQINPPRRKNYVKNDIRVQNLQEKLIYGHLTTLNYLKAISYSIRIESQDGDNYEDDLDDEIEQGPVLPDTIVEETLECITCFGRIDSVINPCGHGHTCFICSNIIKTQTGVCPVCRGQIDSVMKIYLPRNN